MAFSIEYVRHLTATEFHRINRDIYNSGLPTPEFSVSSGRRTVGSYRFGKIVISRQRENLEDLVGTIRHEIAHHAEKWYTLKGLMKADTCQHGPTWQFHARLLGASNANSYGHGGAAPKRHLVEQEKRQQQSLNMQDAY